MEPLRKQAVMALHLLMKCSRSSLPPRLRSRPHGENRPLEERAEGRFPPPAVWPGGAVWGGEKGEGGRGSSMPEQVKFFPVKTVGFSSVDAACAAAR